MINRKSIIIALAAAATTNAFVVPSHLTAHQSSTTSRPRFGPVFHHGSTSLSASSAKSAEEDLELTVKVIMASITDDGSGVDDSDDDATPDVTPAAETTTMIMDIPPSPATQKPTAPKKKAGGNPHKEGVFSPIVVAAGAVLGEEQLNKIRGKVIALHSDLIKSFVDTADSTFGKAVLRQLFNFVDADKSGYLDKKEVATALDMLGFKWLGEKQVDGIFARADADGDSEISLEEFMIEAPKTLRTNLVKLAKSNGGEMGLLV
ncbi:hypothetical protein ACHAXA_011051 [Cyclostephanos tholiformis]|uniref:EF-hand domain-containing protein n=1 Tax=Cyclostephanos tholiformis TaxID=382380 RepID=A0ABD3RYY8_9STRA